MAYQLKITKLKRNEEFEAQLAEHKIRNGRFGNDLPYPVEFITENSLEVTIDDATFAAIRKAAVESM